MDTDKSDTAANPTADSGQVYLFRHDGSRVFARMPTPRAAAHFLDVPEENVYALVPTGWKSRPVLCPYNILTPDSPNLPDWLRDVNFESAWQVPKLYPYYPKHTQVLAKGRQVSFRNPYPFSPSIPSDVPIADLTGRAAVEAMPKSFFPDALSGSLPVRSTVPKYLRHTCLGLPNPFDLDSRLLSYLEARVAVYGPLYVASVLANPGGAALFSEIRSKLAAGQKVLLSETDGPVPEMYGASTDATTGITSFLCTPQNLTRVITTHAAHPVGHCFFLAAELLGVPLAVPPNGPSDGRTFGQALAVATAVPRRGTKRGRE